MTSATLTRLVRLPVTAVAAGRSGRKPSGHLLGRLARWPRWRDAALQVAIAVGAPARNCPLSTAASDLTGLRGSRFDPGLPTAGHAVPGIARNSIASYASPSAIECAIPVTQNAVHPVAVAVGGEQKVPAAGRHHPRDR
jgi:hypothetical protein